MKPSESNAAKQPASNSTLQKRYGTPHNISTGTGGRTTAAGSRPAVNGNIVNNKYGESPNDYGKGV